MTSFNKFAAATARPPAWLRWALPKPRREPRPAALEENPVLHRDTGAKLEDNAAPDEPASAAREAANPATKTPGAWLSPRHFTALLALLIAVSFASVLTGSQSFFFRDFGYFGYPLAQFHRDAFWRGEWPLWNPLNNFGLPFLAQWNTLALYPPSLIYLLLPLPWSLNLFCLAHLLLAGVGMYALAAHWTARAGAGGAPVSDPASNASPPPARRIGDRRSAGAATSVAAAVAGVAFTFNGLTLHCLMWPNNIAALGWLPWLVLFATRAVNEGGRTLLLAALVGALQMLSGAPEIILLTWVVIGGLWLVEALAQIQENRPAHRATGARPSGRFPSAEARPTASPTASATRAPIFQIAFRALFIALLTTLLSAAQLLPFLELLAASQRGSGYAGSDWPMPAWGWANFLVPLFHAFPSHHGVFAQTTQHWTSSYYAGIGVLVLALTCAARVRDRRVWLLTALTLATLLLALGDATPLYAWAQRLCPAIDVMRYPVKFVVVATVALPLLAGLAVAQFLEPRAAKNDRAPQTLFFVAGLAFAGIAAVLAVARLHPLADDVWSATWQNGLGRAVFLALIVGACVALRHHACRPSPQKKFTPALHWLLLLLLWLDGLTHMPWQNPTAASWVYAPREVALTPRPQHGGARAMVSRAALLELHTSSINDPSRDYLFKRVALYDNCNVLDALPKADGVFSLYLRPQAEIHRLLYGATNEPPAGLLNFLGVAHLTAPGKFVEWTARPDWLPTATGGQRIAFATDAEILATLANPAFDARKTVFLPPAAQATLSATNAANVRFLAQNWRANAVELEVASDAPSVVVLAQTFHPNWRATVNGHAVAVQRANHAFQAVPVPAGTSRVVLEYRDPRFHAGLGISALACAGCALGWFTTRRHRRAQS